MQQTPNNVVKRLGATRVLLTINAVLLASIALRLPLSTTALASKPAQTSHRQTIGFVNPDDQRAEILIELKRIGSKLDILARKADQPIDVKVIEMPASAGD